MRSITTILLVIVLTSIIGAADFDFGELKRGEVASNNVATLNLEEFKKFQRFKIRAMTALSNKKIYKDNEGLADKIIFRYKLRTGLIVTGSITQIAGMGLYFSGVKELKPWGAGLIALGLVETGIGIGIKI